MVYQYIYSKSFFRNFVKGKGKLKPVLVKLNVYLQFHFDQIWDLSVYVHEKFLYREI